MKLSLLSALAAASSVTALPTITAYGNKFFTSDGKQFLMKGVAYQLVPEDPLIDTEQCGRDAALMQTLGVNVIRVYHVDPTADHSGCMGVFAKAGIYTLIDMDTFSTYILPNQPAWTESMFKAYAAVMDAFSSYDNSLGFFVGNEVIAINNQSNSAPYIKAAARDLKAYRDARGYRKFPIGYSAADIAELRPMLQDYLTCGGNSSEIIDFFALNSYEWCDPNTYETSGYKYLESIAVNFPVPIFFSETGCNVPGPRTFDDQQAIFGPPMLNDWSGALIYEWIEEANHYGLISYGPKPDPTAVGSNIVGGFTVKGTPTPVSPDFNNLKSQWAKITPTLVNLATYTPNVSTRPCPASTPGGWLVDGNVKLPTLGESFLGTYTTAPTVDPKTLPTTTATANPSGSGSGSGSPTGTNTGGASPTPTKNPAAANREVAGMSAGLASIMFFVFFWL